MTVNLTTHLDQQDALTDLRENFNGYIKFIADRSYLRKMETTDEDAKEYYDQKLKKKKEGHLNHRQFARLLDEAQKQAKLDPPITKTKEQIRTVHGLRHATRVAIYIDALHGFNTTKIQDKDGIQDPFADQAIKALANKFNMTANDILMLTKFAAFFHDSAREGEGKDYWDHRSAENCYDFLIRKGINKDIARFFSDAARYKSDRQGFEAACKKNNTVATKPYKQNYYNYIRNLIGFADTLDIMRCTPEFHANSLNNFLKVNTNEKNRTEANQLIQAIHTTLGEQGDLCRAGCQVPLGTNGSVEAYSKKRYPPEPLDSIIQFQDSPDPYTAMENRIKKNGYLSTLLPTNTGILDTLGQNWPTPQPVIPTIEGISITADGCKTHFATNNNFKFTAATAKDQTHDPKYLGHIASKKDPKEILVKVNTDCLECPLKSDGSINPEQPDAIIETLRALVKKENADAANPITIEPNTAFSVEHLKQILDKAKQQNIHVTFEACKGANSQIQSAIESYNKDYDENNRQKPANPAPHTPGTAGSKRP